MEKARQRELSGLSHRDWDLTLAEGLPYDPPAFLGVVLFCALPRV